MSPLYKTIKQKFLTAPFVHKKRAEQYSSRIRKINTALFLTFIGIGVFYLGQINALATKGYMIKGLEREIHETQKEHKKFEYQIASASSLEALKTRIDALHLVRSERIDYIRPDYPVAVAP